MNDFRKGTRSAFARAVSAEVRGLMAARRIAGRALAIGAGLTSHNYLAIRLRDEKPFTLDDIDLICEFLCIDNRDEFIQRACVNHLEDQQASALTAQHEAAELAGEHSYAVAADDTPGMVEEAEAEEHP